MVIKIKVHEHNTNDYYQQLLLTSNEEESKSSTVINVSSSSSSSSWSSKVYRTWYEISTFILPTKYTAVSTSTTIHKQIDYLATFVISGALGLLGFIFYIPSTTITGELNSLGVINVPDSTIWSDSQHLWYTALSRTFWSLGLAILLYYCGTYRGGLLNALLSYSLFKNLARISYWMYLIHFLILWIIMFNSTVVLRWSAYLGAVNYTSIIVFTSISAGVLHILVECPFVAIERVLFRKQR